MHDIVELIQWAFGGFWRWLGFFLLVSAVGGTTRAIFREVLSPITQRLKA